MKSMCLKNIKTGGRVMMYQKMNVLPMQHLQAEKIIDLSCSETWSTDAQFVALNLVNYHYFADNWSRVPSSVKDLPKLHSSLAKFGSWKPSLLGQCSFLSGLCYGPDAILVKSSRHNDKNSCFLLFILQCMYLDQD